MAPLAGSEARRDTEALGNGSVDIAIQIAGRVKMTGLGGIALAEAAYLGDTALEIAAVAFHALTFPGNGRIVIGTGQPSERLPMIHDPVGRVFAAGVQNRTVVVGLAAPPQNNEKKRNNDIALYPHVSSPICGRARSVRCWPFRGSGSSRPDQACPRSCAGS